jgi:hypothetical protein
MLTEKYNPNDRFEYVYSQGVNDKVLVLKDKITGVHYLVTSNGNSGMGITPLLNTDGTVFTTEIEETW